MAEVRTRALPAPVSSRSRLAGVDLLIGAGLAALIGGVIALARRWEAPLAPSVVIDLSLWSLPSYTLLSLARGVAAYVFSLAFTLTYGTIAAYYPAAERVMVPLLDVLQGIPVLGFLPGLVLGLVALFPRSSIGLELACILMIFTGQVWNMTFSYYGSLRAIPTELREVAQLYHFGRWKRFRTLEVPSAMIGLVWNSMMSMAGGWFFLSVTEAFTLREHDFRLPGVGAYMSVAIEQGNTTAMAGAVVAMIVMIVAVDQLVWRPALAWAQKFKLEETDVAEVPRSFVLDLLRGSRLVPWIETQVGRGFALLEHPQRVGTAAPGRSTLGRALTAALVVCLGAVAFWGAAHLLVMLMALPARQWGTVALAAMLTFLRTSAALLLGALWTVPLGIWIGQSPQRVRRLQPLIWDPLESTCRHASLSIL